ncbi:hypothetical protein Dsin_001652 [Dipteronia sinensis]|uniref:DDE Tnp4 domain-containing protein n=1 Tax=Dipteronia sinensis TaxID=43782 RepID=A0AAE0B4T0_9ROSI|nr:hypothetical protein Dsin_001652 [Dipteronia sinensis]
MNFNIGGPSNFTSSCFDDDEAQLMADLEAINGEQVAIITQHVMEKFADKYLRSPNATDLARLLCIVAIADYDMWIWHAYFGLPSTNNDINVLEASHPFANLTHGIAHPTHYFIQGKEYNMGYYLADGIYQKWSTLVQTIHDTCGLKKKLFAMKQEGCRKDVERAFGVLQSWFAILAGPTRFWQKHVLLDLMMACIIMHNMIIEDERDVDSAIKDHMEAPTPEVEMVVDENTRFLEFLARHIKIKDKEAHIHSEIH